MPSHLPAAVAFADAQGAPPWAHPVPDAHEPVGGENGAPCARPVAGDGPAEETAVEPETLTCRASRIAALSGCSTTTVIRYLRGLKVQPVTKRRIETALAASQCGCGRGR